MDHRDAVNQGRTADYVVYPGTTVKERGYSVALLSFDNDMYMLRGTCHVTSIRLQRHANNQPQLSV